jgi:hypothetical protein
MSLKDTVLHDVQRTWSVWWVSGVIVILAYLGWTGYVTFVKPHTNPTPTTSQYADTIQNNYNQQNSKAFALISWGRFHLIAVDGAVITPVLKQTTIVGKEITTPCSTPIANTSPVKKTIKKWYNPFTWWK